VGALSKFILAVFSGPFVDRGRSYDDSISSESCHCPLQEFLNSMKECAHG